MPSGDICVHFLLKLILFVFMVLCTMRNYNNQIPKMYKILNINYILVYPISDFVIYGRLFVRHTVFSHIFFIKLSNNFFSTFKDLKRTKCKANKCIFFGEKIVVKYVILMFIIHSENVAILAKIEVIVILIYYFFSKTSTVRYTF